MRNTFTASLLVLLTTVLHAQYVNTDRLIVVPGLAEPVSMEYLDSLYINHTDSLLQNDLFSSFNKPLNNGTLLSRFSLPSRGIIISRFGPRSGRMHSGTDIKMNRGDTVNAVYHGTVTRAAYHYGYGNMVVIEHGNSITTSYAHLSGFLVKRGDIVQTGEPVGLAGSTGRATTSHLHFEIRENNRAFDPELVFDFETARVRDQIENAFSLTELHKQSRSTGYSVNEAVPPGHTVRSGDSLWTISRRYRTTIQQLCQLNNLNENAVLQIGMVLKLN